MVSSVYTNLKRQDEHGANMPRLHKAVDHDTGEVYNVETTRQAKRRFQRNGTAQPKPTVGQLNAADIWNKQEDKIKRDREREEKKRKNRQKQEAKEARQKDIQQDLLKEGKISLEQTWGKVNASQNRLHRFFDANRGPPKVIAQVSEDDTSNGDRAHSNGFADDTESDNLQQPDSLIFEDLEQIFKSSPLSPVSDPDFESAAQSLTTKATRAAEHMDARTKQTGQAPIEKRRIPASQDLMPPPKRPSQLPGPLHHDHAAVTNPNEREIQTRPVTIARSPLKEMSVLQVKTRAEEKMGSIGKATDVHHDFLATQVVRDTLSGLSSQDLDDDYEDDYKENNSPAETTAVQTEEDPNSRGMNIAEEVQSDPEPESPSTSRLLNTRDDFDDSGFEGFDDDGIDDESLLSLAATQRLKNELFSRSSSKKMVGVSNTNIDTLFPTAGGSGQRQSFSFSSKLGDSFATDGINDDDLVQNLEDFEGGSLYSRDDLLLPPNFYEIGMDVDGLPGKRRTLPWVKHPIHYSFGGLDGDTDELTPSPQSQVVDE